MAGHAVVNAWMRLDKLVEAASMGKIAEVVEDQEEALELNLDILAPLIKHVGLLNAHCY